MNVPSANRPAHQCGISIATSLYLVQSYTSTQTVAAIPATTPAAVHAGTHK